MIRGILYPPVATLLFGRFHFFHFSPAIFPPNNLAIPPCYKCPILVVFGLPYVRSISYRAGELP